MRTSRLAVAAAVAALAASALSACGGSDSGDSGSGSGPEKTTLKVGVLPIVDDAPLYIAIKKGYFKQQGLTVKPVIQPNGAAALKALLGGSLDLTWSNYASIINDSIAGQKLKVIVDGYQAKPHLFSIMALPKSGIKTAKDLEGHSMADENTHGLGPVFYRSAFKAKGIDYKKIKIVQMPFPDMPKALGSHSVDAIWTTEPFITAVEQQFGAKPILDTATGSTANMPVAGFVATGSSAKQDPNTVKAFQTAMKKAMKDAQDRSVVEKIVPSYTKIKPKTASIVTIGTYPTSLNKQRIQRFADRMYSLGMIKKKFDVSQLMPSSTY